MIVALGFTERELRAWCKYNDVQRNDVVKADRPEHIHGVRGPGRYIVGHTGTFEPGTLNEAVRRGFTVQPGHKD